MKDKSELKIHLPIEDLTKDITAPEGHQSFSLVDSSLWSAELFDYSVCKWSLK